MNKTDKWWTEFTIFMVTIIVFLSLILYLQTEIDKYERKVINLEQSAFCKLPDKREILHIGRDENGNIVCLYTSWKTGNFVTRLQWKSSM